MKLFKHNLPSILLFTVAFACLTACDGSHDAQNPKGKDNKQMKLVGIVLPMDHQALREIVGGFEASLISASPYKIKFKIANAQNDINTQRAIIEQMRDENYDIIVPVTTSTSQMAASIVHKKPIIALAAEYKVADLKALKSCNMSVVNDEIDKDKIIGLIRESYPEIKRLVIVHSASDKVFAEIKEVQKASAKYGFTLQKIMVHNLPDLYSASQSIPSNTQAIIILKDSLIASGINTLINLANTRKIPLITADDGTIQEGAGFALGVHERQIGEKGGILAAKILAGEKTCELIQMDSPTVFINHTALVLENQNEGKIVSAANKLHYKVEILD